MVVWFNCPPSIGASAINSFLFIKHHTRPKVGSLHAFPFINIHFETFLPPPPLPISCGLNADQRSKIVVMFRALDLLIEPLQKKIGRRPEMMSARRGEKEPKDSSQLRFPKYIRIAGIGESFFFTEKRNPEGIWVQIWEFGGRDTFFADLKLQAERRAMHPFLCICFMANLWVCADTCTNSYAQCSPTFRWKN